MKKKNRSAGICNIISGILLVLVILICLPLTVPRLMGYQIYTVVSGSMEPAIPTGSLVYVHNVEPAELKEGDVIAFYSAIDTGVVITHRVVNNQVVEGKITTKGDANEQEDVTPVEYNRVMGIVSLSIPYLGAVLAAIATMQGKMLIAAVILIAVALHLVAGKLQNKKE